MYDWKREEIILFSFFSFSFKMLSIRDAHTATTTVPFSKQGTFRID
jgi:hypothetical protein